MLFKEIISFVKDYIFGAVSLFIGDIIILLNMNAVTIISGRATGASRLIIWVMFHRCSSLNIYYNSASQG